MKRKISVEGEEYYWTLKSNTTNAKGKEHHIKVLLTRATKSILYIDPFDWNFEIRPKTIRKAILFALSNGWNPEKAKSELYISMKDNNGEFFTLPENIKFGYLLTKNTTKTNKSLNDKTIALLWDEAKDWTYQIVDILNSVSKGSNNITEFKEAVNILRTNKESVIQLRGVIITKIDNQITGDKPTSNFLKSLSNLLDCTKVDFSGRMINPPPPFDIFDSIDHNELDLQKLNSYFRFTKGNIEKSWIAFNQSYGRMLIKNRFKKQ